MYFLKLGESVFMERNLKLHSIFRINLNSFLLQFCTYSRKGVGWNVEIRVRVWVRGTSASLEMMNNKALKGTSSLKYVIGLIYLTPIFLLFLCASRMKNSNILGDWRALG